VGIFFSDPRYREMHAAKALEPFRTGPTLIIERGDTG
jgi:hypothetical protein